MVTLFFSLWLNSVAIKEDPSSQSTYASVRRMNAKRMKREREKNVVFVVDDDDRATATKKESRRRVFIYIEFMHWFFSMCGHIIIILVLILVGNTRILAVTINTPEVNTKWIKVHCSCDDGGGGGLSINHNCISFEQTDTAGRALARRWQWQRSTTARTWISQSFAYIRSYSLSIE